MRLSGRSPAYSPSREANTAPIMTLVPADVHLFPLLSAIRSFALLYSISKLIKERLMAFLAAHVHD